MFVTRIVRPIAVTVVVTVRLLLAGVGSAWSAPTPAVTVTTPPFAGVTWTVTEVALPDGSALRLQAITPAAGAAHVPAAGVTDVTVVEAGSVAVMLTLLAATGPLFVTVME